METEKLKHSGYNCKSTVGTVSGLIYFSVRSIQISANK
jgi:hypothetical protein